jgi:hypothetical protein
MELLAMLEAGCGLEEIRERLEVERAHSGADLRA